MSLQLTPLAPVYQMQIKSDDAPFTGETGDVRVEEGSPLCIQCNVDEEFIHETTMLHIHETYQKKLEQLTREKRSVAVNIDKFENASHSGMYLCEVKSNNGTIYSRQMRVSGKSVVPPNSAPCSDEYADFCGSHGACAMEYGNPVCFCETGYAGTSCENRLITDYVVNVIEVGASVSGTVHVASIVLAIIFGVLYFKQRRQYKCMVSYYGPLPVRNEFGELPKNPYLAVCEHYQEQEKKLSLQEKIVDEPAKLNGIQKFRKAIRTRLPGTSDSKLLEAGLDIP